MAEKLTQDQIQTELESTPEWAQISGLIQRTFQFPDFLTAMAFVEALARYAERVQHHPDILIRYNKVTISIQTHDVGGISEKDFDLAREADQFAAAHEPA